VIASFYVFAPQGRIGGFADITYRFRNIILINHMCYNQIALYRNYLSFLDGVVSMTSNFKTASSLGFQPRIAPFQVAITFMSIIFCWNNNFSYW